MKRITGAVCAVLLGFSIHHFILKPRDASAISVTAHYTGYTWYSNGQSHEALATTEGAIMHAMAYPIMKLFQLLGYPTFQGFLMGRHLTMDDILVSAIETGKITQIVEVAAGLSPRGWSFKRKFGDKITYIEADLPAMATRKRKLLQDSGLISIGHTVVDLDVFDDKSYENIFDSLDTSQGVAIVTEGLVNYFQTKDVETIWRRFASFLKKFPRGLYVSDLHLEYHLQGGNLNEKTKAAATQAHSFKTLLTAIVRGEVYVHFENDEVAEKKLIEFGFDSAKLYNPSEYLPNPEPGAERVRVVHALITSP